MNYQKIITDISKVFSTENLEKVKKVAEFITEQGDKILEGMDATDKGINELSQWVNNNSHIPCEMYQMERLDIESLKNILIENRSENSSFAALLNLGRNKNDELEIFLQFLDGNKKAIDRKKVYCIRCESISKELKENFGDKELLVINL